MLDPCRRDLSPYAQGLLDADEVAAQCYAVDPLTCSEYLRGVVSGFIQALGQNEGNKFAADFAEREGARQRTKQSYAVAKASLSANEMNLSDPPNPSVAAIFAAPENSNVVSFDAWGSKINLARGPQS